MIGMVLNVFSAPYTGKRKKCDVCGRFCRETGSALYNNAWKCDNCGVKYYDRTDLDVGKTSEGAKSNRTMRRYVSKSYEDGGYEFK